MPSQIHWACIVDQGSGARVERSSDDSITVDTRQPGEYLVTFPSSVARTGCTATLNNSVGFITGVPGDHSGLRDNQVRVLTMEPDNSFASRDFTVVVAGVSVEHSEQRCVDTLAKLKAVGAGVVPCLSLLGYYTPADGGGGNFYWDASSAEAENGGTVIKPNSVLPSVPGRWRRVQSSPLNVRWFGAKGDGRTHDTNAIQAAIDAGRAHSGADPDRSGVIYFPPGKYRLTKFVEITASVPLTLEGEDGVSEILLSNIEDGFYADSSSAPLIIRRLKFSGSYARAIYLSRGTSTTEIDHCEFTGATMTPDRGLQSPIFIVQQNDVWITNNYIHGCGEQGVKTNRSYAIGSDTFDRDTFDRDMYRWHVLGNTILGAGTTIQVALLDISDSEIINNTIDGGGRTAIWDGYADGYGIMVYWTGKSSTAGNRVSGNSVKNCGGNGIYLQNASNTAVSDNIVTNCVLAMSSRSSLLVGSIAVLTGAKSTADNVSITSNVVKGSQRSGIAVQSNGAIIVGNTITETAEHGLLIDGSVTRNIVANNLIDTNLGSTAELTGSRATFAVAADDYIEIQVDGSTIVRTIFVMGNSGLNNIVHRINEAFTAAGFSPPALGANSGEGTVHDTLLLQSRKLGPDASVKVIGGSPGTLQGLGLTAVEVKGSSSRHGIYCNFPVTLCTISQNIVRAAQGQGIVIPNGCSDTTISGNLVTDCPNGQAYLIIGGLNNVIASNHAVNNGDRGFDLRCSCSLVQGNHAHGNGKTGILLTQASNNRVLDNDCTGNLGENLLDNATNTTRAGNILVSPGAVRFDITTLRASAGDLQTGTKTIENAEVIASSRLRLTRKSAAGTVGHLSYSVRAGAFTILSSEKADESSVEWEVVH